MIEKLLIALLVIPIFLSVCLIFIAMNVGGGQDD